MKFCYCDESGTGEEPIAVMVGVIVDAQRMHVTKKDWSKKFRGINHRLNRVASCQLCNSLKGHFIPDLAKLPGVVVTTASGKKYVAPEWLHFYLRDVKDHIEHSRMKRQKEYDIEVKRISAPHVERPKQAL